MRKAIAKKLLSALLVLVMVLAVLAQAGCTDPKPEETTGGTTPVTTPEASTPDESTPDESTPDESIPDESAPDESAPSESTPGESTPADVATYNIIYDLDGGINGGNPTKYSTNEDVVIDKIPVKPGFDFAGWEGTTLSAASKTVTIAKGTATGDLTFKATWVENKDEIKVDDLDTTFFDADKNLVAKEGEMAISVHDKLGARGEGIYYLKTVYTTVAMDGVKDAAYTYGLHFEGDIVNNKSFYDTREPASFDVYMIRSQDGYVNVYIEVVDPEIVVNSHIFTTLNLYYHCDSIDFYYEYGNLGESNNAFHFIADETGKFKKNMPAGTKIALTDTGYVIETRMDNDGVPFNEGDELGFSFFLNETRDWNETEKTYTKNLIKNHSVLNPVGTNYQAPSAAIQDAVKISLESATGNSDIKVEKPAKTGDMVTDIMSGAASVLITYDEYATAQTIIAAQNIRNIIRAQGGDVTIICENLISENAEFDYEILLGKTTREESQALLKALNYNDCAVSVSEDTIALIGWSEEGAGVAYEIAYELLEHVINGGKTSDLGSFYSVTLENMEGDPTLKLEGFDSITDVGEDAYLIYKLESTKADFEAYCKQLEEGGYKLYTTNKASITHFATYYNDKTVVNIQFVEGVTSGFNAKDADRSLRIVVEPLANTALPSLEKPEDATAEVTVSSISQIYPHHFCMVVQLSNGHFIIIDSGNNGRQKDLSDFLRSKAPNKNEVIVDAWIFTHFHQDHIGGFVDHMSTTSLTKYITVKNVIYNFPQWQVLNTASSKDLSNLDIWYNRVKPEMQEKGTTFYQARNGQKYYFGNAEIEILWSYEDLMPFNTFVDNSNHTCIGFTISIEGTKLMVTGDTTEAEFRVAVKKFGDYLKSDMVQLAHHGGGNGGGDHTFYKTVNAPLVFHPNESESYPGVGGNEKWAINNAELVIRCGNYGTATLYLPYKIGDTIESEKTPEAELPNSIVK